MADERAAERYRAFNRLALAVLCGTAFSVAVHMAVAAWQGGGSVCFSLRWFERTCPMCGMTRSFQALAGGAFRDAVHLHPLGPAMALFLVLELAVRAVLAVRRLPTAWVAHVQRRDVQVHLALATAYVVYAVYFFFGR